MKYFVSVHTLCSTTKLGQMLATKVVSRYDSALIDYDEANRIPQYLYELMEAMCAENKRLKPMTVRSTGYNSGTLNPYCPAQIYVVTEAGAKAFTDNRPFTMQLHPVLKDYTEKGGEK